MEFKIDKKDGRARACSIKTAQNSFQTPVFMPVGTQASVKALDSVDLEDNLGAKIILANTYHLYLRPSSKRVQELGGLHKFTSYSGSFLTDSGGFQAFSLGDNVKLKSDGVEFKSHIDGSKHLFTPKKVVDIQYDLQSDIMMVLDDLVALPASKERILESIKRTTRWAKESIDYHKEMKNRKEGVVQDQNLFAIIQGGCDRELREMSARELTDLEDFDGYAIGGLSVGEPNEQMYEVVEYTTPLMPEHKPRYLMGVGTPIDILESIDRGVDMFDCVMPTRNARNGTLFTTFGKINIKSQRYKNDNNPIDSKCQCHTCKRYTRAYLNHLFRSRELSYFRLASIHNISHYLTLTKESRKAILENRWKSFKNQRIEEYKSLNNL